ncbi:MAG: ABC transporter ATP-binding protein [Patescibacteria group bacterium]|nr:ABC transporter ATP-binding protein [Patescibacteria group bacterium]
MGTIDLKTKKESGKVQKADPQQFLDEKDESVQGEKEISSQGEQQVKIRTKVALKPVLEPKKVLEQHQEDKKEKRRELKKKKIDNFIQQDGDNLGKKMKSSIKDANDGVVVVRGLIKKFIVGESEIQVLNGIDLEVDQGDFAMLVGPSGCGKSTLLHIIYGLEEPTKGEIFIKGTDIWSHTKNWRADFRNSSVGFIPQQAFWLKALSVLENVAVPSIIGGLSYHKGLKRAAQMLELVEMSDWAKHRPYDLSGGQQQRIALARALLLNPWFIIADEPTGNLDQRSGFQLMDLMKDFNERFNITVLMVTHNPKQYKYATKVFEMLDGKIAGFIQQ